MFILGPRSLSWSRPSPGNGAGRHGREQPEVWRWSRLAELVVSCCQSVHPVRSSVCPFVGVRQTRTPPPFEVGGGYTLFYLAKGHPQGGWRPRPTLIASERPDKARLVYVCARARGRRSARGLAEIRGRRRRDRETVMSGPGVQFRFPPLVRRATALWRSTRCTTKFGGLNKLGGRPLDNLEKPDNTMWKGTGRK